MLGRDSEVTLYERVITLIVEWFTRNKYALAFFGFLVVTWEVYGRFYNPRGNLYFPSVSYTLAQTGGNLDIVGQATVSTFTGVTFALVLSLFFGVLFGVLVGESFVVRQLMMGQIVYAYSIPPAIIAPLFIIWFGDNIVGVATFGAWVAFFPVFINTITGISQLDDEYRQLGSVFGATRWQMLRYFKIWRALPNIASSTKAAVQLSFVGVVVAEFLASGTGLGNLIIKTIQSAQLGFTFGSVVIIMIMSVVYFTIVTVAIQWIVPVQIQ